MPFTHTFRGSNPLPSTNYLKDYIMKLKEYDIEVIRQIVESSYSYSDVLRKLNLSKSGRMNDYLKEYLNEFNISTSHFRTKPHTKRTEENVFCKDSTASQRTLREWYSEGNYTEYKCSICGQEPTWQDKPLTLILDHINGDNRDDRLGNLRWVCPNCNQQLDTTGYKNKKNKKF